MLVEQRYKSPVILPEYTYINIIIPRDIAFMADSSEHCPAVKPVRDIMFLAEFRGRFKNLKLYSLQLIDIQLPQGHHLSRIK